MAIQLEAATQVRTEAGDVDPSAVDAATERYRFAELRRTEYARLDQQGHAYLDYTGAALYGSTQIERHRDRLHRDVLGNPHSGSATSMESTRRIERVRERVLQFLHADPSEYAVVFTANASGALRLVGEAFPFDRASRFVLTADNHNSVNGIRRFADRAGARVQYLALDDTLDPEDPRPSFENATASSHHLFAFPAQSNFSGARYPLEWVQHATSEGFRVLLDAAAYVSTARLRLDRVRPDFVCISFYKMFGYPTGVGALVARRDALALLRRPWFGGGTVNWVSTREDEHALRDGVEAFEDGTPNFLAADAVHDGLDLLDTIGVDSIERRVRELTELLVNGLGGLRHPGGRRMVEIYCPPGPASRGGTVAFNVLDGGGAPIPFDRVVTDSAQAGVSVRGGCFCNPGCAEAALRIDGDRAHRCRHALRDGYSDAQFAMCMGTAVGAVRASVGVPTMPSDIDRLLEVVERCAVETRP